MVCGRWKLLFTFGTLLFARVILGDVVINEIMANVDGTDSGVGSPGDRNEYIEIYNNSDTSVVLTRYIISDGDAEDIIEVWNDESLGYIGGLRDSILPPYSFALILDPEYTDTGDGVNVMPYNIPDSCFVFTVGNTTIGDGLSTSDPILLILGNDTVSTYGTPFDTTDDIPRDFGDGYAVERISYANEDNENMWKGIYGGSPGRINISYISKPVVNSVEFTVDSPYVNVEIHFLFVDSLQYNISYYIDKNWNKKHDIGEIIGTLSVSYHDTVCTISLPYIDNYPVLDIDGDRYYIPSYGELPLRLSEFMYVPSSGGDYIEFYTDDTLYLENIEVNGVYIDSAVITNYCVFCENIEKLQNWFGYIPCPIYEDGFNSLNQYGDSIVVLLGDNRWVFDFTDFPTVEDGKSLERINYTYDYKSKYSYGPSLSSLGGTPGKPNSIISVSDSSSISPNPFSPNGDGKDDYCRIYVDDENLVKVRVKITDFYGRVCYDEMKNTKPFEFIWDGRRQGNVPIIGRYLCIIEKIYYDGHRKIEKNIIYVEKVK